MAETSKAPQTTTGSGDGTGTPEMSHTPQQTQEAAPSSASSQHKDALQLQLEITLLQAMEIYHPSKLRGIHRHFVLYGIMMYLEKRLNKHITADQVLQTLGNFYDIEMMKAEEDDIDFPHPQQFSLATRDDSRDS